MKKTVSISIASTPFIIEEDAYQVLEQYLADIKKHFSQSSESGEIISDIESRIAEQFIEATKTVVSIDQVQKVIASMGSADQFDQDSTATPKDNTPHESVPKHLYRNPDDKIIAGVASGFAAYLSVDVVWVRVMFSVLAAISGLGVLIYIVFWVCMPKAEGAVQHLEMTGTPVTLETLSERAKERAQEVPKNPGMLRRIIALPFILIQNIFSFISTWIFPAIKKIIGVFISLSTTFVLLGLSVGLGFSLLNLSQNFTDFPVHAIAPTSIIAVFVVATYFAFLVPFLFLLFLGTSLIVGKSTIRMNAALGLLGVWFIALLAGGIIAANYSTRISSYIRTAPEYQETSRIVQVSPFTEIQARNGIHITYTESPSTLVTVLGNIKEIDRVSVKNENGILIIESISQDRHFCIFCNLSLPSVTVNAPAVHRFTGEDAVRIDVKHVTSPSDLAITLSNGSRGTFDVTAKNLTVNLEDASWIEISGTADTAELKGENATAIDAKNLSIKTATVEVKNASHAEIGPTVTLHATATNAGHIRYQGNPTLTEDASNASSITSSDRELE